LKRTSDLVGVHPQRNATRCRSNVGGWSKQIVTKNWGGRRISWGRNWRPRINQSARCRSATRSCEHTLYGIVSSVIWDICCSCIRGTATDCNISAHSFDHLWRSHHCEIRCIECNCFKCVAACALFDNRANYITGIVIRRRTTWIAQERACLQKSHSARKVICPWIKDEANQVVSLYNGTSCNRVSIVE